MDRKNEVGIAALSSIFKALSDETRLKILCLLRLKPLCVCEIMGALDITQTKTSRHLIYMKNAGLLESSKEDRWVVYRIRDELPPGLEAILEEVIHLVEESGEIEAEKRRLKVILKQESIYRQTFEKSSGRAPKIPGGCPF